MATLVVEGMEDVVVVGEVQKGTQIVHVDYPIDLIDTMAEAPLQGI